MRTRLGTVAAVAGMAAVIVALWTIHTHAQVDERPGCSYDNPIDMPRDLSGCSIKIPRIRIVHTT